MYLFVFVAWLLIGLWTLFMALAICANARKIIDSPLARTDSPRVVLGVVSVSTLLGSHLTAVCCVLFLVFFPPIAKLFEDAPSFGWVIGVLSSAFLPGLVWTMVRFPWRQHVRSGTIG